MICANVTTQDEFAAALQRGNCIHVRTGEWRAFGSATVWAFDSATVRASGSATVLASGSATVRAFDSATVRASKYVTVIITGGAVKAEGGIHVHIPKLTTVEGWCEFYGLTIEGGIVTLYKGLDESFGSSRGMTYTPGSVPVAPDWDDGVAECGGGLHFSPRPFMALQFAPDAKRFVACPVAVADIRQPQEGDTYPEKVKASRCAGPVYEVTIDGDRVAPVVA